MEYNTRLELAEDRQSRSSHEAAENLRQSAFEFASARPRLNVERESQSVANAFDLGKNPNHLSYTEKVIEGTNRLSADLMKLADTGNMSNYNKLLKASADKIPDEPACNPGIHLDNFNPRTGTWDDVSIRAYVDGEPHDVYRIVIPGDTISQIAKNATGEIEITTSSLQRLNNISDKDVDKIKVGQAIKLRDDFGQ
jgi:hypothetical protein